MQGGIPPLLDKGLLSSSTAQGSQGTGAYYTKGLSALDVSPHKAGTQL